MFIFPNIDPVALYLGPLNIRWYGLMYLLGFFLAFIDLRYKIRNSNLSWTTEQLSDLLFYIAMGVIFGGRLGYVIIYQPKLAIINPFSLIAFWEPGRSFHGGMLGVALAVAVFTYKQQRSYWATLDLISPVIPLGLLTGRIGNFLNGELWGRITDVPWAIIFPHVDYLPRHPSQLYAACLEGLILWLWLRYYTIKPRVTGTTTAMFLLSYGILRFLGEFFREPDFSQGFVWKWLTMGQLLSLILIFTGGLGIFIAKQYCIKNR